MRAGDCIHAASIKEKDDHFMIIYLKIYGQITITYICYYNYIK